ncbi:MAG TPA: Clp protease N-terminal domain-containing protein [Gaiellaceae bacterium]|nr:Clp protease N-terminal domain-containing protein [Gaiellaceae bacterium]
MFERFTESARQVIVLSQNEAVALRHDYIGTEHILLGLLREESGLASAVLVSLEINFEAVRAQVERIVGKGDADGTSGQMPLTPRAKKTLDLALREALALGHEYVGTEHILLGLGQEREGVAFTVLRHFGADAETIRNRVIAMLSDPERREPAAAPDRSRAAIRVPPWEYRIERVPGVSDLAEDSLNALGGEGWELAGVVPGTAEVALLFKRRSV